MNIFDNVLDPSVVSHSVTGHFTTTEYLELLVVRTNIISLYKPIRSGKLYLVDEFRFDGRITDIALVAQTHNHHQGVSQGNNPQGSSSLNYLLLSTAVAKLSVLLYNPVTCSLETRSLHYYEDQFRESTLIELARESRLRVDPNNQCALVFNNDVVAILPFLFNQNEDEEDEESNDTPSGKKSLFKRKKSKNPANQKITGPSLVINCSELGQNIKNVVDIQFLHSFTKPTLAIIYQPQLSWYGTKPLKPYPTEFSIVSLELASNQQDTEFKPTTITQISDLPSNWHTLVPTVSGSLIVGVNELAYIDNTGVLQTILLLNGYSEKNLPKVKFQDQSTNEIYFLENTVNMYVQTDSTSNNKEESVLLLDENGFVYNVILKSEGRLLTKFNITKLPFGEDILKDASSPTCITTITSDSKNDSISLFIGFNSGDSVVLRLNHLKSAIEIQETLEQPTEEEKQDISMAMDEDDDDDDDIDLYSDEEKVNNDSTKDVSNNEETKSDEPFTVEQLSNLRNIGPITSLCTGKVSSIENNVKGLPNPNKDEFSVVCTSGNGTGSHLNAVLTAVQPEVEKALKFISITKIWNIHIKGKDKFLITTDSTKSQSNIYEIDNNFALHKQGRLRKDATTIHIATFGDGKRIVQVTTNHLYLYDLTFRRFSTIKFDYEVVHVSVMDPYVLITLSRGDIKVFELEPRNKKKLFKVELPEILSEMVITSGLILKSNMCNEFLTGIGKSTVEQMLFTFVTADNQIIFFTKDHNDRIFQLNGVNQLQDSLYISTYQLPDEVVPDPSIKQVMINKLGNKSKDEYLTILTFGGEIYQYKKSRNRNSRFYRNINRNDHPITGAPDNAYAKGVSTIERIMHYIPNFNGYSVIFVTGSVPYIIISEDDSSPKIFRFGDISLVSMTRWGEKSVMCVDDIKNARVYSLKQQDFYYGNKLPIRKINVSTMLQDYKTLTNVVYHERTQLYLVSYCKETDYVALAEDGEPLVGYDAEKTNARAYKSGILLINPRSWEIIDQREFGDNSLVNDVKSIPIQIDTRTKRKREYVVVGLGFVTVEDVPPTGEFHIYDITEVVPEPGKPNTNFKLSEIFKEEVRGIVSAVNGISGRFLISQSQKVMVRDVQEDNSVIPVAFLDVPVFVTAIKSFGNLVVVGDAMQGVQFVGFDAEPYRMLTLATSVTKFEVVSVEFLVNGGDVCFAVTDRNRILHVLRYAPDEPNSLSGQRLVHCSSFNLLSHNTATLLVPRNLEFPRSTSTTTAPRYFQTLASHTDGSLSKIVPLDEDAYRRLYFLQQHIVDHEQHLAGLNPRMERQQNDFFHLGHALRPMLDMNTVRRYTDLSTERRAQIHRKLGRQANIELWRDLINIDYSLRALSPASAQ
ncbi:Protein CFT1 [Nakaseomyces bracarensis]|uniref:Protein CFT1 n=1 Tax=Nakaseomyces bracarensis TaxID=273131 RepID=A0ABR4NS64_9SACH